jgi:hypothetical protein
MATRVPRLARAFGAILVLTTLAACVGPQPRYYGGGGYGRSYAYHQPVYRGGYNQGWQGGHQRGWR